MTGAANPGRPQGGFRGSRRVHMSKSPGGGNAYLLHVAMMVEPLGTDH
jgi:hypothetical protein